MQQIVKAAKKTFCFLGPINVSKIESIHVFAALFIKTINVLMKALLFHQKSDLLSILQVKRQSLDQDNMAIYHPMSNLTFLSKVIERAVLHQLWKVLEKDKIIPAHQFAYRKLHSTETALCHIYNDLIISTCQGQTSPESS